jgi:hypothetical protein
MKTDPTPKQVSVCKKLLSLHVILSTISSILYLSCNQVVILWGSLIILICLTFKGIITDLFFYSILWTLRKYGSCSLNTVHRFSRYLLKAVLTSFSQHNNRLNILRNHSLSFQSYHNISKCSPAMQASQQIT